MIPTTRPEGRRPLLLSTLGRTFFVVVVVAGAVVACGLMSLLLLLLSLLSFVFSLFSLSSFGFALGRSGLSSWSSLSINLVDGLLHCSFGNNSTATKSTKRNEHVREVSREAESRAEQSRGIIK